jgi:hypothetical protein
MTHKALPALEAIAAASRGAAVSVFFSYYYGTARAVSD